MSVESYQLYIDGKWVSTPDSYEIRSPATEELVATVAKGGVEHVDAAVAAARRAHESGVWRNTSPEDRANLLLDVAERLGAKADQLAALQTRENGATIRITGALHIGLSIAQLQFLAVQSKDYEYETAGPAIEPIPAEGIVRREPVGVVAAIVPWNIPYLTTIWKIAPALAAGNTVSSSRTSTHRCAAWSWRRSSTRPACPRVSSTSSPATASRSASIWPAIPASTRWRSPDRQWSARASCETPRTP